ncbi:MAG: uroporphyrinogen decarboxylase family protein [Planctomycetota bacterium]
MKKPMGRMSSRERMLLAITGQESDHVPCSFMIFSTLERRCRDAFEFVEKELALGLDAFVQVPPRAARTASDHGDLQGPAVRYDPRVKVREWREKRAGERYPILCKAYETPAGELRAEVAKSEDWPHGDHVPFLDDYLVPRSIKPLVQGPGDLEALKFLLRPTNEEDAEEFRASAREAKKFAEKRGLLLVGGWGVGADLSGWLCGLSNLVYLTADEPEFVRALMEVIASWNRTRMELILGAGVDLFIRRGWYEGTDFWSPTTYRELVLPRLREEARLAHSRGAKFGYINTTGNMQLLGMFAEAEIDVLIGVDPVQGRGTDMQEMKRRVGGKVALWGGVNGFVTVEMGTRAEVETAVMKAMEELAPGGGFILSPVDNVTDDSERTWENVRALIEAWKKLT